MDGLLFLGAILSIGVAMVCAIIANEHIKDGGIDIVNTEQTPLLKKGSAPR